MFQNTNAQYLQMSSIKSKRQNEFHGNWKLVDQEVTCYHIGYVIHAIEISSYYKYKCK